MKNFLNRKKCAAKAYWSAEKLGFRDTLTGSLKKAMKDYFFNNTFDKLLDINTIYDSLSHLDKYYQTIFEKEEVESSIAQKYQNIYQTIFQNTHGLEQISKAIITKIRINNSEITVSFDGIFKLSSDNSIVAVKIVDSTPEYGATSKAANYYYEQPEYYLMYAAAKELYPGHNIIPTIIYTKPKTAKKTLTAMDYMYAADYSNDGQNDPESNLYLLKAKQECISLSNIKPGIDNKTCDESECQFCPFNKICKFEEFQKIESEIVTEIKKADSSKKFELTPAQKEVVNHFEGEARVLAGAGSGKTTCLINRVINMIELGKAQPKDFLLITFTEKGAREMKEKLNYWVKEKNLKVRGNFTVETFNSFGAKVINQNYEKLGFTCEPYLADDIMGYDILLDLSNQGYRIPYVSYSKPFSRIYGVKGGIASIYDAIQLYKGEEESERSKDVKERKFCKELGCSLDETLNMFYTVVDKYNELLKDENIIDYSDQINMCLELLNDDEVLKQYGYKHIVIDEFQDTSAKQLNIVKRLYKAKKGNSLLVCGDDAQAIFGFRGVGPENIISFKKHYPDSKDIYMVDNFRSTKEILSVANKAIGLNSNQIKKDLIAHRDGCKVEYNGGNLRVEDYTEKVVKRVLEALKTHEPKDIAVLCSTRLELLAIRRLLNEKGVASVLSISEKYVDDPGIIGVMGLLSWLSDRNYLMGLVMYQASVNYDSVKDSFNIHELAEDLALRMNIEIEGKNDEELYSWIFDKIRVIKETEALTEVMKIFEERYTKASEMQEYINKLTLYQSEKSCEADEKPYNAVTISTVHASKGREWDVVIVSSYKLKTVIGSHVLYDDMVELDYDDERIRLLYVAITRAKKELCIVQRNSSDMLDELENQFDYKTFKERYPRMRAMNYDGTYYNPPKTKKGTSK